MSCLLIFDAMQAWQLLSDARVPELVSVEPKMWAVFATESVELSALGTVSVSTGVILSLDVAWNATVTSCRGPGADSCAVVVPAAVLPAVDAPGLLVRLCNNSCSSVLIQAGARLVWLLFSRRQTPRPQYVYPALTGHSCSPSSAASAIPRSTLVAADAPVAVAELEPCDDDTQRRQRRPRANRANARLRAKAVAAF